MIPDYHSDDFSTARSDVSDCFQDKSQIGFTLSNIETSWFINLSLNQHVKW